jgi:hypothetical protein
MGFPVPRSPRSTAVPAVLAGLLAIVLTASACSSSGGSSDRATPQALPTTTPVLPDQLPKNAPALARLMAHGLVATGSAHLTVDVTNHGVTTKGGGGVTMVNGKLTGFDLVTDIGALHGVRTVDVNSVTYARLPHPARAGKPWSAIAAKGGSAALTTVRSATAATEQLAAPATILALVSAGHASLQGAGKVAGGSALHYAVSTKVAALPRNAAVRAVLARQGVTSVRLDLWVDGAGRPVTVRTTPTPRRGPSGTVRFRDYNQPVALQAPDPKAIAHG